MNWLERIRSGLPLFWVLQLIGWGFYAIVKFALRFFFFGSSFGWNKLMFMVAGFGLSLLLYHWYQFIRAWLTFLPMLVFVALTSSFTAGAIWFICCELFIIKVGTAGFITSLQQNPSQTISLYLNLSSVFVGWSALYFGTKFWQDWQTQKERAEIATAAARQAQLKMLRYQLNPHFLFNSLNSLRAMISEDQTRAKNMVTELSNFLRYTLTDKQRGDNLLRDEFDHIENYLKLEKIRFEDRLDVETEFAAEIADVRLLCFLLHPLVENAIKHGKQSSPKQLKVRIKAFAENGWLCLEVSNSGKLHPRDSANQIGTGTGLQNIRARLQHRYPGQSNFSIEEKNGWIKARITIKKEALGTNGQQN